MFSAPQDDFPELKICHEAEDFGDELTGEEVKQDLDVDEEDE